MDDGEAADSGRFYRLHRDRLTESGLPPIAITNGPALSPDGTLLYHTDPLGKRIWRTRIAADGPLQDTALFVEIEDGGGYHAGPTRVCEVWNEDGEGRRGIEGLAQG